MAYTLDDFIKLNPAYRKRYDPATNKAYLSNSKTGKEISFDVGKGQQYGIGALENGSQLIDDPTKLTSALSAPEYTSPYSDKIANTLSAISNRGAFSYNPSADIGLQTAQENAMDAVSRAAARRGMLYSDSNKSQMGKSALALVPQYEQAAYNRYNQEGQNLYSQLNTLSGLENQSYGKYRDTVGDERYAIEQGNAAAKMAAEAEQNRLNRENTLKIANINSATEWERLRQAKAESDRKNSPYDKALKDAAAEVESTNRTRASANMDLLSPADEQAIYNKWLSYYGMAPSQPAPKQIDPIQTEIDKYVGAGATPAEIRQALKEEGIDPAKYGY